jgi:hypothetical protein
MPRRAWRARPEQRLAAPPPTSPLRIAQPMVVARNGRGTPLSTPSVRAAHSSQWLAALRRNPHAVIHRLINHALGVSTATCGVTVALTCLTEVCAGSSSGAMYSNPRVTDHPPSQPRVGLHARRRCRGRHTLRRRFISGRALPTGSDRHEDPTRLPARPRRLCAAPWVSRPELRGKRRK